jgi:lipoprotein-anchoring transpeptidase ErfK/SrfK
VQLHTAQQGADACCQLLRHDRLGDVIVGTGLEPGHNAGGDRDTHARYIYLHGTPDTVPLGVAGSRGCVRMRNAELIALFDQMAEGDRVFIYD